MCVGVGVCVCVCTHVPGMALRLRAKLNVPSLSYRDNTEDTAEALLHFMRR